MSSYHYNIGSWLKECNWPKIEWTFFNAYKFHTKAWVDDKKTTNSGLYFKCLIGEEKTNFMV